jgi:hypothetical protein
MTRTQIRHQGRLHALASDWDDPFTEDFLLRDATRTLGDALENDYFVWSADITAGQSLYCLPSVYYIESADAKLSTDPETYPVPLEILIPSDLAGRPGWRVDGGTPLGSAPPSANFGALAMVVESLSSFSLYPTPAVSVKKGLTLRGFGWIEDALWPEDAHECPLLKPAQDALCWLLGSLIAAHRGDYQRAQYLEGVYRTRRNRIEIKRVTMTEALRQRYARLLPGSPSAASGYAAMTLGGSPPWA